MPLLIRLRQESTSGSTGLRSILELTVDYPDTDSLPNRIIYDNRTWSRAGSSTSQNYRLFDVNAVDLVSEGKLLDTAST